MLEVVVSGPLRAALGRYAASTRSQTRHALLPAQFAACNGATRRVLILLIIGTECFLAQMRAQKREILERLSSARNFLNMDDEENYSAARRAVRQVGARVSSGFVLCLPVLPLMFLSSKKAITGR